MKTRIKIFENDCVASLNSDIAELLESENANVVDVKVDINQSQHKPLYSTFVVVLIYSVE